MAITKLSGSSLTNITKYDSFLAGNTAYDPGSYYLIERVTVGSGGSSSVSFTSIPSTYKNLQIRAIVNSTKSGASGADSLELTMNSDATAIYSAHRLFGDGSGTTADGFASLNYSYFGIQPQTTSTVSYYGAAVIDILDYTNTSKYKTIRSLQGFDANGSGRVGLFSGCWQSTSAISSIQIYSDNRSANFTQYSSFALYGQKG